MFHTVVLLFLWVGLIHITILFRLVSADLLFSVILIAIFLNNLGVSEKGSFILLSDAKF